VQEDRTDVIHISRQALSLERLTYATIVLMSVLVVYDGWGQLASFAGAAVVILGPTLALAAAHLFSEALHAYAEHERPLTAAEWRRISTDQLQILFAALPPLLVLTAGWLGRLEARSTIIFILWTGWPRSPASLLLPGGVQDSGVEVGRRGRLWRRRRPLRGLAADPPQAPLTGGTAITGQPNERFQVLGATRTRRGASFRRELGAFGRASCAQKEAPSDDTAGSRSSESACRRPVPFMTLASSHSLREPTVFLG
jgi:hypothetical protein